MSARQPLLIASVIALALMLLSGIWQPISAQIAFPTLPPAAACAGAAGDTFIDGVTSQFPVSLEVADRPPILLWAGPNPALAPDIYGPYNMIYAINRYCVYDSGSEVCTDVSSPPPLIHWTNACKKVRVTFSASSSFDAQISVYGYFNGPSESTEDLRVTINGTTHDWKETNTESPGWHVITVPGNFHFNKGANDIWMTSPYYPYSANCKKYGSIHFAAGCPSIHGWYSIAGAPSITPPSPPSHTSPGNNTVFSCHPGTVVLQWSCRDNEFQAQLARDSGFNNIVATSNWMAPGEEQPGTWNITSYLTSLGTYWWRVHARNDGGTGNWSSPWQFTLVNNAPSQATLVSPSNNAWLTSRSLALRWNACTDDGCPGSGISYEANIGSQTTSTGGTAWNVTVPADSDYAWRARAYDGESYGAWSNTWTVRVDTERPMAQIISGPSGTITNRDVTFTWTGSDNRTIVGGLQYSYRLIGYATTWSSWSSTTSNTWTGLPVGSYVFEVKVRDLAGWESSLSALQTFAVVAPPEPPVVTPSRTSSTTLRLSWPKVVKDIYGNARQADGYHIYRSTTPYWTPLPDSQWKSKLEPLPELVTQDAADLGDPSVHHFYIVRALYIATEILESADSNRTGEFEFWLVPGSP